MSSKMTLLALTFSLIKKEGSILIKAEVSQGGTWKNPSMHRHRDPHPSVAVSQ